MNRKLIIAGAASGLILAGGGGFALWHMGMVPFVGQPKLAELVTKSTVPLSSSEIQAAMAASTAATSLVRQLGLIQDRIAHGDRDALAEQAHQLASISATLNAAPKGAWANPRYVVAMLGYVLGGGDGRIIKRYLAAADASAEYKPLAEGILAFKLRQTKRARAALGKIDDRRMDLALAGALSLAQASLVMRSNPEEAATFLDEARLYAPHTAIEEAALRWQMPLLIELGKGDKALQLASQYFRRYAQSVYAQGAREKFAAPFAAGDAALTTSAARDLLDKLEAVSPDVKSELYITIARQALLAGNISLARFSAHTVLATEPKSTAMRARAEIYAAAADAPSENAVAALAALKSIAAEQLEPEDVSMRDAADQIARSVLGGAETAILTDVSSSNDAKETESKSVSNDVPSTMAKADKAMKQADAFIGGQNR